MRKRNIIFIIENYEKMYLTDFDIITKLEISSAKTIFIPFKIDFNSKICSAVIMGSLAALDDLAAEVRNLGFQISLAEGGVV